MKDLKDPRCSKIFFYS